MSFIAARPLTKAAFAVLGVVVAVTGFLAVRYSHAATLVGDLNGDGTVNVLDLSIMLSGWHTSNATDDLNSDGTVNIFDLSVLLSHWGQTASGPPSPGASLPISYSLSSLTGNVRYVAPTGNDTTGTGSSSAPYATLAKAVNVAASGDSIVIRGGTYRQGNISTSSSKSLHIVAYPGEIPVFNGAQTVSSGWVTENSLQYIPYTPMPVTDGSGISFTTGQNLNGSGVGKYPDQAWIGNTQLQQVDTKAAVVNGKFFVDSTNNRLYMTSSDSAQSGIEVSSLRKFLDLNGPNSTVEGLRVTRYSNSASDYGVINITATADGALFKNVEVTDSAFQAMNFSGSSDLLLNCKMQNVTISTSNWMGVVALYTNYFTMDSVKINNMNQFDEFASSPQSGALKTSRTWYTTVQDSDISNNTDSKGLWFDQSNYDTTVADNTIQNNGDSGVMFEISDRLTMVNNYVVANAGQIATRLAGSSGLRLVNNTIVGGVMPVGTLTDNRSIAGCSDPAQPLCANSYNSDRDSVRTHQATLDWMPRIDLFLNNIIAYPTSASYCGSTETLCITLTNGSASVTIDSIIHQADPSRGIPRTLMDGNVYANGTSRIIQAGSSFWTTTSAFTTAMAGSPVSIAGLEANGKYGNTYVNADGSPTSTLAAIHGQAVAVPTDSEINAYVPAGTRHFGVTYK